MSMDEKQLAEIEARAQAARFARGQMRHLYSLMVGGYVASAASAATGLLGPSIERLEEGAEDVPALVAEVRRLQAEVERLQSAAPPRWCPACNQSPVSVAGLCAGCAIAVHRSRLR